VQVTSTCCKENMCTIAVVDPSNCDHKSINLGIH
jgi:hypothetical protein